MFKGKSDYRKARDSICSITQQNCQQYSLYFLLSPAQGFEKQTSMIALSVVVLFFLYTVGILTNAEPEAMLSHPILTLLILIVLLKYA